MWKSDEDDELDCCVKYWGRIGFIILAPILFVFYEAFIELGLGCWLTLAAFTMVYLQTVGLIVFIHKLCKLDKIWLTRDDDI